LFNYNGWVPNYGDENYDKTREEMRVQDGSTSSTLWTELLPWDALPLLENPPSGWLHNCNEDGPWSATFPLPALDPANYAQFTADMNPGMTYRPQISARLMTDNSNIDLERFTELKMSTIKEEANHGTDAFHFNVIPCTSMSFLPPQYHSFHFNSIPPL
jgi:acyl-homoserine-lactone acylase